ncbi:anti-silencing protein [Exidia glandulosa HHB12029]|uniref:Anti-silencing function protein 1 n=1 Tax=Exidia glandulosa HHB12029 TaxID=1314781 RepID=A0A166AWB7_EXIGL|nr:anti-silencing protein [Exidia glandulosa HHB12029]
MITIRSVEFLNNPARFLDPYRFKVTFDCVAPLKDDLEWKLIFVSSPGRTDLDQELDDCLVGPVPVGINSFEFQGAPPDTRTIPPNDVLGVAALILTGSYNDQEFVRIGYYQNTEYDNPEMKENPPASIVFDRLTRELNDKPRVTRFHIKWDGGPTALPAQPAPAPIANGTNVAATSVAVPSADAL